ncbi:MAG: 30S ribosomal protein S11 [Candidatus Nomurabacteria bacterium]|nr:30S ribosomal protein S11 [Candidatus Nomurabacteria bacterium]
MENSAAATASTDAFAAKPAAKKRGRKVKRSIPLGQAHIQATFNNTIVTFSDNKGNVLTHSSAGACGFRGSKKGTAYAAQIATDKAAEQAKTQFGLTKINVFVKGVGLGRDAAIRALTGHEMIIESISDVTGVPHGGVRPKKQRSA